MTIANCVFAFALLGLYIGAGGSTVTASPLQGVQDRYDFGQAIDHRARYDNATTSPVITARHVPQDHSQRRHIRRKPVRSYSFSKVSDADYQTKRSYSKPAFNEVNLWDSKKKKVLTSGVFRTYGKGRAVIPYTGASVYVPKSLGHHKAHKGTITTKILTSNHDQDRSNRKVSSRSRRDCYGCPDNHIVVATKGNTFVILPEPCPTLQWVPLTGPRPGTKLREGRHWLTGRLGHRWKVCQYQYQVIVRHCQALESDELNITCNADDAWGSKCTSSCGQNRELVGSALTECTDNLTWSQPLPTCKRKDGCAIPEVPDNSKVSCQTANHTYFEDTLPEGSYCRITAHRREEVIQCLDGMWAEINQTIIRPRRRKNFNEERNRYKYSIANDEAGVDFCQPNPCKNGGTCLKPTADAAGPICNCKPPNQGPRCELQECQVNICENGGRCFIYNHKTICYCSTAFFGNRCQIPLVRNAEK